MRPTASLLEAKAALLAELASLKAREETFWATAQAFVANRDAHGVMDMGAELQALERARKTLERLLAERP